MKYFRVKSRAVSALILVALVVCAAGCQEEINFPAPTLISISPATIQAGEPTFNLTVTGKGFTPSSSVSWSSSAVSATLVSTYDGSTGQLIAQIPATYIASPGIAYISVSTPQPGGGVTPTLTLTINPNPSAVPKITGVSPTSVAAGSSALSLTISGEDFVAQSTVMINGVAASTSYSNSTTLTASIPAGDLATGGTVPITVYNPPPDGGASNVFPLDVDDPVPSLTSLTPTSVVAGSASASIVLTGTNFVANSTILINGSPRATAYSSSTQVSVTLTAGDLTQGGLTLVEVENPAPGGGVSNVLPLPINPTDIEGLPDLVDWGYDGTQANNGICGTLAACASGGVLSLSNSGPSVSTTGEYVAFASDSTNLLDNQANVAPAIFVRNTCLNGTASAGSTTGCTPNTLLVNLGVSGALPNGPADQPSLDSAGTHVAYTSTATNMVSYASVNGTIEQVYWQPACLTGTTSSSTSSSCGVTGSTGTAALVSVAPDGVTPGNANSYDPVISPDGEYVAFVSLATNLVSGVTVDGVTPQVYVRNTCNLVPPAAGSCIPTTYLVSTQDGSVPPIAGNGASSSPAIANDGLFVSFTSQATNLLNTAGGSSSSLLSGAPEVFERSTCITTINGLGGTCSPSTKLISSPDQVTPADGTSGESSISQDGRFVAFASTAQNLIPGIGPTQQVYVSDTCAGVAITTPSQCAPSLNLVSTADGVTPGNALSENPSVNGCITSTTVTVSCGTGQFIAFATQATNLGPNVQNGVENIFVRNTCLGVVASTTITSAEPDCATYTFLASQPQGAQASPANGNSIVPALSGDGRVVSFLSSASNLVPNDTNVMPDAFIAEAAPTVNLTVSLQGNGSGKVTDSLASLNCVLTLGTQTGECSANYIYGSSVTLTATAGSGYTFTGWGGNVTSTECPADTDTCTVTLIITNSVTATFK